MHLVLSLKPRCGRQFAAFSILLATGATAWAQSSVTIYGSLDQYVSHLRSSSGKNITALEDGAVLRSRLGFRGKEELGGGLHAKFQLEMGINADNGTQAEATRGFDRQSWVGLGGGWGEVRLGRQNTALLNSGGAIDFTGRTLGSMVNNFGVPARFDNDIAYISPRVGGLQAELHYAMAETGAPSRQALYQAGVDYMNGSYQVGYTGLYARAPQNAPYKAPVRYDNVYANYDHGKGKIYLALARSNNSTASVAGNNAGSILSNIGGVVAGTNADVGRYYRIWQVAADYRVLPKLRLGALWGQINGPHGEGAKGATLAAYYDLSKRTMLFALAERMANERNTGFRLAGSGGLKSNLAGDDVNGRTIKGVQVGAVHRF
ncbi:porin [Comamonas testosteroni]|uniref:porin n=2 Tax=Comamonas testosteroni TaxID=285 RepID=UPI00265DA827|nr:porin [Comamonas testosteroni]WKL16170.1 porin [Comamonas testosteroni]